MNIQISIIILVNNEISRLPKLFSVLEKQKGIKNCEIITVDSGSTDGSKEFLFIQEKNQKQFKVKFYQIKSSEFGHGKTRNYAIKKAKAKIIVFLVADALPTNNNWLSELIKPLNNKNVVGVFGRQIPYEKTSPYDQFFYQQAYPNNPRGITKKNTKDFSITNIYFSNCNGAVKAEILRKYPFPNDLVMSEDQWWAYEILSHGYKIVYGPKAAVYHSHNYSLISMFRKQFTSGYSLIGFPKPSFLKSVFYSLSLLIKEALFLGKNYGMLTVLGMFIYEPIRYTGFILGSLGKFLPNSLVQRTIVLKHPRFKSK